MALNKNHQTHQDMTAAFDMADKNTPRDSLGGATYGMGAKGMPRTPAQQASVKKAALKSATARGARAGTLEAGRSPKAPVTPGPAALQAPSSLVKPAGVSTGSLSIAKPRKGLLSL
jgi:hypothetical protein